MFALDILPGKKPEKISQVGGGGFLNHDSLWPEEEDGIKMIPILTLRCDIFAIPTIPEGMCITIFVPYKNNCESIGKYRICAKNDMLQSPVGMKVILHEDSLKENFLDEGGHYPAYPLIRREFSPQEQSEDLEDANSGIYISKIYGRPSWLQDEIFFPVRYAFTVQLTEADLVAVDKDFEGVFNDGSMYVYLMRSLKKMKHGNICGEAFIQFT